MGSTFFFWIPCEAQVYGESEASEEELIEIGRLATNTPSILLVDDNSVNQLVIKYVKFVVEASSYVHLGHSWLNLDAQSM